MLATVPAGTYENVAAAARALITGGPTDGRKTVILNDVLIRECVYFALTWTDGDGEGPLFEIAHVFALTGSEKWFLSLERETEGIKSVLCPPWLLKEAPDTTNEAAAAWRRKCLTHYGETCGGLKPGTIVSFDQAVRLDSDTYERDFRFWPVGSGGKCFISLRTNRAHAIPHFYDRPYTVRTMQ